MNFPSKIQKEEIDDLKISKASKIYSQQYLKGSGWYRIAHSIDDDAFICAIQTRYNTNNNCSYIIAVNMVNQGAKITLLSSLKNNVTISKARVTIANDYTKYLEIYYNSSTNNQCKADFSLINNKSISSMPFIPVIGDETVLHEITL